MLSLILGMNGKFNRKRLITKYFIRRNKKYKKIDKRNLYLLFTIFRIGNLFRCTGAIVFFFEVLLFLYTYKYYVLCAIPLFNY